MKQPLFIIFILFSFPIFSQSSQKLEVLTLTGSISGEKLVQKSTGLNDVIVNNMQISLRGFSASGIGEVIVNLKKNWHINTDKPLQPYLIPSKLMFETVKGIEISDIQYPFGKRVKFEFASEEMLVWDEAVQIKFKYQAKEIKPGNYELKGIFRYQACDSKTCLPPDKKEFTISFKIGGSEKKK